MTSPASLIALSPLQGLPADSLNANSPHPPRLPDQHLLALVTSHFTLDKQNAAVREHLAEQADFAGAMRLPSDAFRREGTAVVMDILFLRKRAPGEPPRHADPDWLRVEPVEIEGAMIPINRYFLGHPEMVLGTWSRKDRLYDAGYSVVGSGDLAEQLQRAVRRLPEYTPSTASPVQKERAVAFGLWQLLGKTLAIVSDARLADCP